MLLFRLSAIAELLTGLALLLAPATVVDLLLGNGPNPTGIAVARIMAIGLISIAVAGWESQSRTTCHAPRAGLCTYNLGVGAALILLGAYGGMDGILLWPAAVLHAMIGALMLRAILVTAPATTLN